MPHEKSIIHVAGHITYIVLYGLLIVICILIPWMDNLGIWNRFFVVVEPITQERTCIRRKKY
jgi:hypothetical protein